VSCMHQHSNTGRRRAAARELLDSRPRPAPDDNGAGRDTASRRGRPPVRPGRVCDATAMYD
jgi:hypothetical protein